MIRRIPVLLLGIALFLSGHTLARCGEPSDSLAAGLAPFLDCVKGETERFHLAIEATVVIDGKPQKVDGSLTRYDDEQFDLVLKHSQYAVTVLRRDDATAFVLPRHGVRFVGRGVINEDDHLAPAGAGDRLISSGSQLATYLPMLQVGSPDAVAGMAAQLLGLKYEQESARWAGKGGVSVAAEGDSESIRIAFADSTIRLTLKDAPASGTELGDIERHDASLETIPIGRNELERHLARGLSRTLEIFLPSPLLTSPARRGRRVANGELRWVGDQRLVLLSGSPEEIGRAHGELLAVEANRCIDSVLHAFGTVQTIRTGKWFPEELAQAYARLEPHIPADHLRETEALAVALNIDPQRMQTLNVFPELFHCSGFALFGEATDDGKLYHGRVLDYMTTIGLQDAATTFVVAVDGKIPFANVGYAGFVGSVSGMNAESISLGEMGGGGEGEWDGAPMATLMRRALEECSSLSDVKRLWRESPRTCEYYYVFADGETGEAVGVAALPDSIEFIAPGQSHERLGEGIRDAVVLSAGSRLEELRRRVHERHGQIDVDTAQWLMSRPVAMESNLHNVLFVPADGVFYVANASHRHPAAERPYQRYDLRQLLRSFAPSVATAAR